MRREGEMEREKERETERLRKRERERERERQKGGERQAYMHTQKNRLIKVKRWVDKFMTSNWAR